MLLSISEQKKKRENINIWYNEQVTKQINEGKDPVEVKTSLNLSHVKPLHAKMDF